LERRCRCCIRTLDPRDRGRYYIADIRDRIDDGICCAEFQIGVVAACSIYDGEGVEGAGGTAPGVCAEAVVYRVCVWFIYIPSQLLLSK
jgi:hypothetical protein